MKVYAALLKPDAEPVLVREGFAWGALFLGRCGWLCIVPGLPPRSALAAYVLLAALAPRPAGAILAVGLALILGFTGHDLRCWAWSGAAICWRTCLPPATGMTPSRGC